MGVEILGGAVGDEADIGGFWGVGAEPRDEGGDDAFAQPLALKVGVNNDIVISFTFGLGSALAGAGGILYALNYPSIDPLMGVMPGLKAFVAAQGLSSPARSRSSTTASGMAALIRFSISDALIGMTDLRL